MDLNPENPIQWKLRMVHPLIKRLLLKCILDVPLAGRFKHFIGAWTRITQDPKLLDTVKVYKISFYSKSIVTREGEELMKLEVKEMLEKGTIKKVHPSTGEFISKLFLVKKKDGGQVIN